MPKLNQLQHSTIIKKEFKRQTSTWAIAKKDLDPVQADYAAEPLSP